MLPLRMGVLGEPLWAHRARKTRKTSTAGTHQEQHGTACRTVSAKGPVLSSRTHLRLICVRCVNKIGLTKLRRYTGGWFCDDDRCPFGCTDPEGKPVHTSSHWTLVWYKDSITIAYNGAKHRGPLLFPALSQPVYEKMLELKPQPDPFYGDDSFKLGLNAIHITPPHSVAHLPCTSFEFLGAENDSTWYFLTREPCVRCGIVHYDAHNFNERRRSVYKLRRNNRAVLISYPCSQESTDHGLLVHKPLPTELPEQGKVDQWLLEQTGRRQPAAIDGTFERIGNVVRIDYSRKDGRTSYKTYEFT